VLDSRIWEFYPFIRNSACQYNSRMLGLVMPYVGMQKMLNNLKILYKYFHVVMKSKSD